MSVEFIDHYHIIRAPSSSAIFPLSLLRVISWKICHPRSRVCSEQVIITILKRDTVLYMYLLSTCRSEFRVGGRTAADGSNSSVCQHVTDSFLLCLVFLLPLSLTLLSLPHRLPNFLTLSLSPFPADERSPALALHFALLMKFAPGTAWVLIALNRDVACRFDRTPSSW